MSDLLILLLLSIFINVIMFIPAYLFNTDKFTDFSYSLSFIVLISYLLINNILTLNKLLLATMIFVWSLRLGSFLVIRIKRSKKDRRFDGFRSSFMGFLKFWLLQAIAVWIILLPSMYFYKQSHYNISYIGIVIWFMGFLIETIADYQKFKFRSTSANKDLFIQNGLWKYSRHPNYFGEILVWIGIYVFTVQALSPIQIWISLLSPLFIILLLAFVSGLPQLEQYADKKWGKSADYIAYKSSTSILIPWFKY